MEFDVSGVATAFAATVVGIGAIGAGKLLPNAAIKAWSWFTAAIRGG
jgi:hypothetical protein